MAKHEAVVFLSASGEEISNDPIWLAQKTLREAGVETTQPPQETDQEDLEDDDESTGDYSEVKGKDLTALAKERNISLKNEDGSAKKAGDVRAELIAQDEANKAK